MAAMVWNYSILWRRVWGLRLCVTCYINQYLIVHRDREVDVIYYLHTRSCHNCAQLLKTHWQSPSNLSTPIISMLSTHERCIISISLAPHNNSIFCVAVRQVMNSLQRVMYFGATQTYCPVASSKVVIP